MEFRIPRQGGMADDLPTGDFACYEVHIVRCRLWFSIPDIIIRTLKHFGLSIGQINLTGLQHVLGILVLGYEHGVPLSVDHFEALLKPLAVTRGIYRLAPCTHMSIIRETISNGHAWEKCFFPSALVARRSKRVAFLIFAVNGAIMGSSSDRFVILDFFHSKVSSQGSETSPVAILSLSGLEEGSEPSMDEFLSRTFQCLEGTQVLPRAKRSSWAIPNFLWMTSLCLDGLPTFLRVMGVALAIFSLPDCNFDELFKDRPPEFYLPSTVDGQARSKGFVEGSKMVNAGLLSFNSSLEASYREATARNKDLERKHAKDLRRAERRGKCEVTAVIAGRDVKFKAEFGKLRGAQELMGDFRECRGAVGALSQTRAEGYVFQTEMDMMTSYMGEYVGADAMVSSLEEKVLGCWDPIPVFPDTEETVNGVANEGVEVNQSFDTFGRSMSGNFELDP
ncbi:hypothetical protein N665_0681s0021 [Sinapis alba]|nr:hypothetical protein N665_0681s0021 [Sinapis alba]